MLGTISCSFINSPRIPLFSLAQIRRQFESNEREEHNLRSEVIRKLEQERADQLRQLKSKYQQMGQAKQQVGMHICKCVRSCGV